MRDAITTHLVQSWIISDLLFDDQYLLRPLSHLIFHFILIYKILMLEKPTLTGLQVLKVSTIGLDT